MVAATTTKDMETPTTARPIPVRRVPSPDADLPRWWFGGSPVATHVVNALGFVFPEGERFFIRSVRAFEDRIDDPALRQALRGFYGQEAQHQRAHRELFGVLEAQGYEIASFLAWFERVAFEQIEPSFSPAVRLATTAALEHFTATLGARALETDVLDAAHPSVRRLLRWHAAEEIEHKAVAWDVFQAVDGRWRVRALGFAIALGVLVGFVGAGTRHLLRQEPRGAVRAAERRPTSRAVRRRRMRNLPRVLTRSLAFLRPGFHPDERDDYHLASAFFAEDAAQHPAAAAEARR